MTELERQLAAIPRPEPTGDLDRRVAGLFIRQPSRRPTARWKATIWWSAATAGIALAAFWCGRWSADSTPPSPVASALSQDLEQQSAAGDVQHSPLGEDKLAGLFVPVSHEGMFGREPLQFEISTSP